MDPEDKWMWGMAILVLIVVVTLLASCAYTSVDVAYTDPGGKDVRVSYTSTKDISVDVVRDADGRLQQLHVGGAASPVIDAQTQALSSAIGAGVAAGLRAAPP